MNKNIAIFILLSIGFGLGAVFLAKNWLDDNQTQEVKEGQGQVITINAPLSTGSIIEDKHISIATLPESLIPKGAISNPESAVGMVVKHKLYAGDILHAERVAKKGEGSSLASLISKNMRAVSIRVNDVVGVSGFILPGNKVDILVTYKRKSGSNTEVVLSNIKILAVDQRASSDENKPKIVRAVTIEVTLEQAETLMSAKDRGHLQLALRNPNDEAEFVKINGATDVEQLVIEKPVPKDNNQIASINVLSSRSKVEIIRGIKKETVQVSN